MSTTAGVGQGPHAPEKPGLGRPPGQINSSPLPPDGTVVVVGASLAGLRAVETLRNEGFHGRIVLVGEEQHLPYDRPPLSKQVLSGEWPPERAMLADVSKLDGYRAELVLGHRATALDAAARTVTVDDGSVHAADGIVVATGASPRQLPGTAEMAGVRTLRTVDDSAGLRSAITDAGPGCRVVVIGAGFIGSEVAATCQGLGCQVTVVEALATPLAPALGEQIGAACGALHAAHGVDLRTGAGVAAVHPPGGSVDRALGVAFGSLGGRASAAVPGGEAGGVGSGAGGDGDGSGSGTHGVGTGTGTHGGDTGGDGASSGEVTGTTGNSSATPIEGRAGRVELTDGTSIPADVVVVGIGVVPNTGWLAGSGLEVTDGVVCDAALFAADGVVAAGDLARWPHPGIGRQVRIEHWQVAAEMGVAAARSLLAGRAEAVAFDPVPYFWSDQYGLRIQVIGRPSADDTVEIVYGDPESHRFVALYGAGGRLTAALAISEPRRLMRFRPLLAARASYDDALALELV